MPPKIHGHPQNRPPSKFLPHGAGQPREILQAAPVLAIPAKAVTCSLELVPTYTCIWMIEQKAVAPGDGQVFRCEARIVPGAEPPDKDAVQFGITKCQNRLVAFECTNQFIEDEPQGFRHAAVHFE